MGLFRKKQDHETLKHDPKLWSLMRAFKWVKPDARLIKVTEDTRQVKCGGCDSIIDIKPFKLEYGPFQTGRAGICRNCDVVFYWFGPVQLEPEFGDIFYSEYFKSRGVVVSYKDEDNWWFVLESNGQMVKARAKPNELRWLRRGDLLCSG